MNDFERAKALITDKNNSLIEIEKKTGISYPRLSVYRANPDKLKTASWDRVHEIAKLYDETMVK